MRLRTIALLVPLLLTIGPLLAQPDNILVDKYTFSRPKKWQWKAPGGSGATNRFVVSATGKDRTDVQFFVLPKADSDFRGRILGNFNETRHKSERSVTVADVKVTYFTAGGTAIARDTKQLKHEYQFTGAILPTDEPEQFVFVRIAGPRAQVEPAINDFCEMIERALADSQGSR